MVVRLVMVVMVLLKGNNYSTIFHFFSMQRGGRVFKFTEDDFKMDTYIINEDLTREYQQKSIPQIPPQEVCDHAKPPM